MIVKSRDRTRCLVGAAIIGASASAVLVAAALAAVADGYETPPTAEPAAVLPPDLVSGGNFHVVSPVASDGLMHHFDLETPFGQFTAYGRVALAARVREVEALTTLSKTSKIQVVAGGIGHGIASNVETVAHVATHPIGTVIGIPRGIAHLFHGAVDQSKEAVSDAKKSTQASTGDKSSGDAQSPSARTTRDDAAKRYAKRYFGVTAAERHWYQKLGVDPYTDNAVLTDAIRRTAKVEAAAGFGMKFAGLPAIPGIGMLRRAEDAIYNENPATIRMRTRKTLETYGLTPPEVDRFSNSTLISPTRQVQLVQAAEALQGVDGRAEIFRHAVGLTSDAEAQVYLHSVGLLVLAHHKQPVASLLAGVRLPSARRADGHVVVCGAFEAVYWTGDVDRGEQQVREALPTEGITGRELWLSGGLSDKARAVLAERGWIVVDAAGVEPGRPES